MPLLVSSGSRSFDSVILLELFDASSCRNKSAKKVQADCIGLCKFKCTTKISSSDRKNLFESYWSLNDSEKGLNMPASHIIQTFLFRAEKPLNALCTYIQSGQVKLLANSYF
jgi:hypothetical protein